MADRDTSTSHAGETASIVEEIARKAGDLALAHFRSLSSLSVETKGHLDLVTKADKEVETFLIAQLREAFPADGIFGEEGAKSKGVQVVSG